MPRIANPKTKQEIEGAIKWYRAEVKFVDTDTKFKYQHEIEVLKQQLQTLNASSK